MPSQKLSSRISVTEINIQTFGSASQKQRRRNSVKDDPGSTSRINGRDGRDGGDGRGGRGSPQSCHLYRPDPTNVDPAAPIQPI